ncbi:MAG: RNA methyltransferase [Bacteroidales bacterium]|nr:RNA methyltransferase [Bacteroidales bacterium]
MRKLKNAELNRLSVEQFKTATKSPFVIVLDNIRSQNNVGSVFRTADAFLVGHIYLCGITATPPHREIHKTALGATDSVEWSYLQSTQQAIKSLKEHDYQVYAIEQAEDSISLDIFEPRFDKKIALVFGHEVKGVSEEIMDLIDGCIEIPQYGTKHSLNISVSVGVVMWDLFRKHKQHVSPEYP